MTNKGNTKKSEDIPLSQKVKNWVEEQGYSLEMRVAKMFREAGFDITQFHHFIDQETQSVRPAAVVASLYQDIGKSRIVFRLFVECKYSAKDKPWVIIVTSDKFSKYAYFSRTLRNQHPSKWQSVDTLQGRVVARIVQSLERNVGLDSFSIKHPGYIIAESLTNQKDHAYEATVQISKCVEAHDNEVEGTYKKTILTSDLESDEVRKGSESQLGLFFSIAFPVVVTNGQLFECYLGDDRDIAVSEIQSGTVFVPFRRVEKDPHAEVVLSPVTVVTEKYLKNYIESIMISIETMLTQSDAIQAVIEFEHSNTYSSSDLDF